jgi:hypothetical protein
MEKFRGYGACPENYLGIMHPHTPSAAGALECGALRRFRAPDFAKMAYRLYSGCRPWLTQLPLVPDRPTEASARPIILKMLAGLSFTFKPSLGVVLPN